MIATASIMDNNALYVLDMDMNKVGEISNFGITESIKSVNYDLDSDSDFEISLIKLNSAMYNGQLDVDTFNDSLQHEISHFYDFMRWFFHRRLINCLFRTIIFC